MAVREFEFTSGPETASLPSVSEPAGPDDLISQGYADARYTQGSEAVADNAALKAIAEAERRDGDFVLVKDSNRVYRFDSASADSDDGNFILAPDTGTGRWIRLTILNQAVTFTDTTDSTSKDTGAMILEGGLGVEKNLNVGGNTILDGDLTVQGTTTTINTETLDVEDANIGVNRNGTEATADANVAGLTVQMTDATDVRIGHDSTLASRFKAGVQGSESEVITASTNQTFTGDKTFNTAITSQQVSTPANPSPGFMKLYPKTDGTFYKLDSSGNEIALGAGGGLGEINYIDNFDFETGLTGWATYADAAGSTPVDGTGGSAVVSLSQETGVVLRGDASLKLTKQTGSKQGEGFSYDFTIKEQDASKKLKIQFDFKTDEDAGFAQGDLGVYIYDVTNAQLITPVDTDIIRGTNIFQTSFNSTTSLSYRLIFHIQTTNAAGYDAYIDNVIVGPGMTSQGAAIGPVKNTVLTLADFSDTTGLTSAPGKVTSQRVGDCLSVNFTALFIGTATAGTQFEFSLANAIGENITFQTGNWGEGFARLTNTPLDDTAPFIHRFSADGTGVLKFTQSADDVVANRNANNYGNVQAFDRDQVCISALIPVIEWQGSGIVPMLAEDNLSEWQAYTPPGDWSNTASGTTLINAFYRRVGDSIEINLDSSLDGALTASTLQYNWSDLLPDGLSFNSSVSVAGDPLGVWTCTDDSAPSSSNDYAGVISAGSSFIRLRYRGGTSDNILQGVPFNWAVNDRIQINLKAPISEWAGSQNSLVGYSLASETQTGLVSASAQTFGGDKTFEDTVKVVGTGVSPASTFGQIVVENDGQAAINLVSDNAGASAIYFGDVDSFARGGIFYDHATEDLQFRTTSNTTRMTIDTAGNVGINEASPASLLHVTAPGAGLHMRLEGSGGNILGGFAQTASGDGVMTVRDSAGTTINQISADATTKTYFNTLVGIGNTNPTVRLQVNQSGAALVTAFQNTESSPASRTISRYQWSGTTTPANSNKFLDFFDQTTIMGSVSVNGTQVLYNISSDARLKEEIEDYKGGLEAAMAMKPRSFKWKKDGKDDIGFIAQEVYDVFPNAVRKGGDDPESEAWAVDYGRISPVLLSAIKELKAENDELKARLAKLEEKLNL